MNLMNFYVLNAFSHPPHTDNLSSGLILPSANTAAGASVLQLDVRAHQLLVSSSKTKESWSWFLGCSETVRCTNLSCALLPFVSQGLECGAPDCRQWKCTT